MLPKHDSNINKNIQQFRICHTFDSKIQETTTMGKFKLSPKSQWLQDVDKLIKIHDGLVQKEAERRRRKQEKKLKRHLANVISAKKNDNKINTSSSSSSSSTSSSSINCSLGTSVVDKTENDSEGK